MYYPALLSPCTRIGRLINVRLINLIQCYERYLRSTKTGVTRCWLDTDIVFPTSMPDIQESGCIDTRYGPPAIWKLIGSPVLLAVNQR